MPENIIGQSRRSHCVGNFGPGAIVEFRSGSAGAAVSAVVGGLEMWDTFAKPGGLKHPQVTYERRLQTYLNVDGFRLPPVDPNARQRLAAVRFPQYLQCPRCQRVRPAAKWDTLRVGDPARVCSRCGPGREKVHVVPVRFVVACANGHLQEFPWDRWVQHKQGCGRSELKLFQSEKAGLAGLILECTTCGAQRPMEGALGRNTMDAIGECCGGHRPWLGMGAAEPGCDELPRAVQRGASNLYFPVIASALAIPPFTEVAQAALDQYWHAFAKRKPEEWPQVIEWTNLADHLEMSAEEILDLVRRGVAALNIGGIARIRLEEYEKLSSDAQFSDHIDFDIRPERVPPSLARWFDRIVRVVRLREVRAIRGFTRIHPPAGELEEDEAELADIYETRKNWLPAIEVRGEGIFLRLNAETLGPWEKRPDVMERAARMNRAFADAWERRHGAEKPPPRKVTPRFLLVHSLAHALIRQLTATCGYSTASLRERLYADDKAGTAGLLIYTATPDSDGSLGGLERQAKSARIRELVPAAIRAMEWCSNDPLCIEDVSTFSDPQNGAACHSCMMVPETSCEEFNVLLDRTMLVGSPTKRDTGFFAALLDPLADL